MIAMIDCNHRQTTPWQQTHWESPVVVLRAKVVRNSVTMARKSAGVATETGVEDPPTSNALDFCGQRGVAILRRTNRGCFSVLQEPELASPAAALISAAAAFEEQSECANATPTTTHPTLPNTNLRQPAPAAGSLSPRLATSWQSGRPRRSGLGHRPRLHWSPPRPRILHALSHSGTV